MILLLFFSCVCLMEKAPLIKIIFLKVFLMLLFFTNGFKIFYNFVQTSVADFFKFNNYFDKTMISLLISS